MVRVALGNKNVLTRSCNSHVRIAWCITDSDKNNVSVFFYQFSFLKYAFVCLFRGQILLHHGSHCIYFTPKILDVLESVFPPLLNCFFVFAEVILYYPKWAMGTSWTPEQICCYHIQERKRKELCYWINMEKLMFHFETLKMNYLQEHRRSSKGQNISSGILFLCNTHPDLQLKMALRYHSTAL